VERVGEKIVVAVADNGHGIPADKLNAVLERFVQLRSGDRRGGVGLGLYISKCIIEGHGGESGLKTEAAAEAHFPSPLPIDEPT
jgi:signal transduction histidine kinase